jgi:hypothetical protein
MGTRVIQIHIRKNKALNTSEEGIMKPHLNHKKGGAVTLTHHQTMSD